MTDAVLETVDLAVSFGGVHALTDVSVACRRGELTGMIGPNGAGKTTFIDAVTGFLPANRRGRVMLDGVDVTGLAPHELARQGLNRTWQSLELFDDITVRANLEVAARPLNLRQAMAGLVGRESLTRVEEILERFELHDMADRLPSELSQGQRKVVGVARALAAESKIALLDEPAAGLDRGETSELGRRLRQVVDDGHTLLLIDHDMDLMMDVCDHIHVIVFGQLIASGHPDEVRRDPEVMAAYLGTSGDPS